MAKKRNKRNKAKRESPIVKALSRLLNVLTVGVGVVVIGLYQMTTSGTANSSPVTHESGVRYVDGQPTIDPPTPPPTASVVTCDGLDQAGIKFDRFSIQGSDKVDLECLKAQALAGSARPIDQLDALNRCDQHVNYVKLGGVEGCMDFMGYDVTEPKLAAAIASTEANHVPAKIPFCDRPAHDRKVKRKLQGLAKFVRLCWTK